jgi:TolB-like protein/tetratricopeptide (TPR) repeat protein
VDPASLFAELKRRRVFRALVGYGIAAFAVLQIIEPVMHGLHWPDAVLSYVVVALAAGFPIVVSLAWIFDVTSAGVEKTAPSTLRGSRLAVLLVGIGVLAAAPGLLYYFVLRAPKKVASDGSVTAVASIAVLPLTNLSRDPDQEYFADGLTEELLDMLAKVPGLHVAARTSAFAFKGKNEDARAIGEKLNVTTLLEGSVRRAGDQVRITTQLINATDGYHLWSETYDRRLTDVFAVQDDIARSVVTALKLKLLPGQAPTSKPHRTSNPEVYNQYLLGRQFFNQFTREGFIRATHAFEKALALDPEFAPAVASLADATYWVADSAETTAEVTNGQRRAIALADKAVALDPELTEAYVARGSIRAAVQWDWRGAESDFKKALSLTPESAGALLQYARNVLRALGRVDEAIAAARKVTERDPLNAQAWSTLGSLLLVSGDYKGMHAALDRSLEITPQQAFAAGWLGIGLVIEGKPADALVAVERSTSLYFRLTGAAIAHHSLGHAAESQKALDELIGKFGHSAAYQIAVVYAWRGDKDRAFAWLERAYAQHDGGLTLVKIDPLLRDLRGDARYSALLAKLKLPR